MSWSEAPVSEVARRLKMFPHAEGGYFRETWRGSLRVPAEGCRAPGGARSRPCGTSILYLLGAGEVSRLHRLRADEVWHFHAGGTLAILRLSPDGSGSLVRLGADLEGGDLPQVVVPAGTWVGARLAGPAPWGLVGCTVAPGFEPEDLAWGDPAALAAAYPSWAGEIRRLGSR